MQLKVFRWFFFSVLLNPFWAFATSGYYQQFSCPTASNVKMVQTSRGDIKYWWESNFPHCEGEQCRLKGWAPLSHDEKPLPVDRLKFTLLYPNGTIACIYTIKGHTRREGTIRSQSHFRGCFYKSLSYKYRPKEFQDKSQQVVPGICENSDPERCAVYCEK